MQIIRTEPETGGPSRTPRDRIEPVFSVADAVEPDSLIDASTSQTWEIAEGSDQTRWSVQMEAFRQFVSAAEQLDSRAATEQVGGSDEKGGIYTAFFNHGLVAVGEGDDDGDINSSNFDRKVNSIVVRHQDGYMVQLPYGGTEIMPACRYLDKHYLDEFGEDESTGQPVPVSSRPKRARVVFTDGEMSDAQQFGQRLAEDHSDLWPDEHWFVAILGYGADHDKTLALYNRIAETHRNVHVYSFDSVTNAAEIAEDMAIAVLAKRA